MADVVTPPENTMRERRDLRRGTVWFLVRANRLLVAGVFLAVLLAMFVGATALGPTSASWTDTSRPASLFGSLVIVVVTAVALVLTIAQLVISEEVGSLAEQTRRMDSQVGFRTDVETVVGADVASPDPAVFLDQLVTAAGSRADDLLDAVDADGATASYARAVRDHSDAVSDALEDAQFGTFDVLLTLLNYNYSWKIHAARQLLARSEDHPVAAREALEDLVTLFRYVGTAREYVKTLYIQWEVANLARLMLYTAVPALAVAAYGVLGFDPGLIEGATVGIGNDVLAVAAAVGVTLVPICLLLAYVLRVVTVAKWTLAIGPFILRETKLSEPVE